MNLLAEDDDGNELLSPFLAMTLLAKRISKDQEWHWSSGTADPDTVVPVYISYLSDLSQFNYLQQ